MAGKEVEASIASGRQMVQVPQGAVALTRVVVAAAVAVGRLAVGSATAAVQQLHPPHLQWPPSLLSSDDVRGPQGDRSTHLRHQRQQKAGLQPPQAEARLAAAAVQIPQRSRIGTLVAVAAKRLSMLTQRQRRFRGLTAA